MGSLFDGKYSQRGNRSLPITEAYLEPSPKSSMESSIVDAQLGSKYAFACFIFLLKYNVLYVECQRTRYTNNFLGESQ